MLTPLLLITGAVIWIYVTVWFIISLILKRNDVADIAWGAGIVLVGLVGFLYQEPKTAAMQLAMLLVAVWGLRLSTRIFLKNKGKGEDSRYKAWRESWGKWFYLRSYGQVFLLQGALMIVIGYPLLHLGVFDTGGELGLLHILGAALWAVGFFFEAVGDYQLDRFLAKEENKGRIMKYGLWRYSRHPNYFGEVAQWWGIWLIVLSVPFGFWAIISPLAITFLILKVSGVPMLEKQFAGNPEFEEYKRTTSIFFPLPPKQSASA